MRVSRKPLAALTAVAMAMLLAGCAQGDSQDAAEQPISESSQSPSVSASGGAGDAGRVILIGNQAFGDHGPMDDMAAALDSCNADYGLTVKKIATLEAADYQSAVNSAASDGYDLIITTFPQMTAATVEAAENHPDIDFAAVYQFVNIEKPDTAKNIWDSSYDVSQAAYAEGALAATLSKSKKLGIVVGDLDPTLNAIINAFTQGAQSVSSDVNVKWSNADSFGDPAKGKDLATAMISGGIDVIATDAAQTQLGALDAAKDAGVLFFGDNGDNSALYPAGFVSELRAELGKTVKDACKSFVDGTFKGGEHSIYNLENGGAGLNTDIIEKWGEASDRKDDAAAAMSLYKSIVADIGSGKIEVVNNPDTPK